MLFEAEAKKFLRELFVPKVRSSNATISASQQLTDFIISVTKNAPHLRWYLYSQLPAIAFTAKESGFHIEACQLEVVGGESLEKRTSAMFREGWSIFRNGVEVGILVT